MVIAATTQLSREQTPSFDSSIVSDCPLQTYDDEGYLEFSQDQSASPSALSSFIEAVNFCEKVLNIQDVGTAVTPKAMNLSELANARRKEKRQAKVLRVQEVSSLESFIVDRFVPGCFLFALFSLGVDGTTSDVFMDMPLTSLN